MVLVIMNLDGPVVISLMQDAGICLILLAELGKSMLQVPPWER